MTALYLQAFLAALDLLKPDRRARIEGNHHNFLMKIREAERAGKDSYTDDALIEAKEDLQDFLAAFKEEVAAQKREAE